jgi:Pin2-interacting protein X1
MTMVLSTSGDTQNQAWAADKSRFGFKMLQMMGWKEGKGLGVNEDGATAHIKMKKKDNSRGIGADIGQNDRWDSTMSGFNNVLDKLASAETGATVDKGNKKKKSKDKKEKEKSAKSKKRKRTEGVPDEAAEEAKKEKRRRKEERAAKREAKAARRAKKEKLVFAKRAQNKRVSNYSAKALAEIFGQAEVVKTTAAPDEPLTDARGRLKKK